ncbi:MAG TPA: zinc-dependent metalloprotease, partial [Blastocatellia bacterium]|nr:zinc-dependent metalloprotease [Blastocatellia bacterium]
AQTTPAPKSFSDLIGGLRRIDGYIPLYWDETNGKLLMEISRFNQEFLYQISLPAGVGSNPIGLDRGQLGFTHIVEFERVGPKVLLVSRNYKYRALTGDPAERRDVEESFANSVLWGFKVEATDGGRVLVDATPFFLRDAHGVIDQLRMAKQGMFHLDDSRSALYLDRTKGFPLNTEVEATLTFTSDEPGPLVVDTAAWAKSITVREHHSLVQLPDDGYKPRAFDPRVGVFGLEFDDFSSPITEPVEKRWIERHRLQKKDPNAAVSEAVKPIIYYVDNGAPPVIRKALVEGASWWNEAFEAAGFKDAFQVRVLPPDADPMDIRYNVINWVDRSSRGWSYGASVVDPRTGEIIKGNVTLGSLRVRQDYTIGTGLVPAFANAAIGSGQNGEGCDFGTVPDLDYLAALDPSTDPEQMALARVRQLSAHEVGHTLGLAHNFAASTYGRASVMDYPAPMVEIKDGKLDLSNAYTAGIGAYDKFAIQYAYSEFAPGTSEKTQLRKLVEDGIKSGMLYLTDEDARPAGAANPLASLWDNGPDPVVELKHEMEVRRIGLQGFGLGNIPEGTPLSMLEAKLVPLYLHHRYQLTAAIKSIGGTYYTYTVKTANGPSPAQVQEIVPAAKQREALAVVLETIQPDELALPPATIDLIPPRAFGYGGGHTELFPKLTDPVFDPVAIATIAADITISGLLEPHRAARLSEFHARDKEYPGFAQVVGALLKQTLSPAGATDPYHAAIMQAVEGLMVTRLMDLAVDEHADAEVKAIATEALRQVSYFLKGNTVASSNAFNSATRDDIERFLMRPYAPRKRTPPLEAPPGDPIGSGR